MSYLTPLRAKNYLRLNINLFLVYILPLLTLLSGSLATSSKHQKQKVTNLSRKLFKEWIMVPRCTPTALINLLGGNFD